MTPSGIPASAPFPGSGTPRFHLRDDRLHCEEVDVASLARTHGTPLYVYSAAAMRDRYAALRAAFGAEAALCFAVKSNPTLRVLRLFHELGAGFDVVSIGELHRVAQATGGDTSAVVFAGAAKRRDEIDAGMALGVRAWHVETLHELPWLDAAARRHGVVAEVGLRLNPDVAADTHGYIATGRDGDKFGLGLDAAAEAVATVHAAPGLRLRGYHVHLGSQLRDAAVYAQAFDKVAAWLDADPARSAGVEWFDLGGGFGIAYGSAAGPCDVDAVAAALLPRLRARGLRPVVEPGRYLTGDAGVLVTAVLAEKPSGSRRLVLVDAAMNDLLRPALYGAHHPIEPVIAPHAGSASPCDVVGPVCESGDFLGRDLPLRAMRGGELLAVLAAGAYGAAMASNYNSRPRAAEVLVDGASATLVRRRERLEDLWALELEGLELECPEPE